jgi:hypothetical protein
MKFVGVSAELGQLLGEGSASTTGLRTAGARGTPGSAKSRSMPRRAPRLAKKFNW